MLLGLLTAFAASPPAAVQRLILHQLEAFERSDRQAAWQDVAPGLKQQFGDADRFYRMVQEHYQPVIKPHKVSFGEFVDHRGSPAQWLTLEGRDGQVHRALYLLEKQPDGSWRTSGCLLFRVGESNMA